MTIDSRLSNLSFVQEILHEADKNQFPERHWLTKDTYTREDTLHMCFLCSEHYKWSSQMIYDARTETFHKKRITGKSNNENYY